MNYSKFLDFMELKLTESPPQSLLTITHLTTTALTCLIEPDS